MSDESKIDGRGGASIHPVDRPSAIAAASVIAGLGALLYNMMPLLIGSAQEAMGWSESELGTFAALGLAGAMLGTLLSVLWIRRVNWRVTIASGLTLGAAGFAAGSLSQDYLVLMSCMFFAGTGSAIALAPLVALAGDGLHPDRNFAFMILGQVVLAAAIATLIPGVDERFGFKGVLLLLSGLTLLGIPLIGLIPTRGRERRSEAAAQSSELSESSESAASESSLPVFVALFGLVTFFAAITCVWAFVELIGNLRGLSDGEVGTVISVSLLIGGLGALAVAVVGDRISLFAGIAIGSAGLILSFGGVALASSFAAFGLAMTVLQAMWNFSLPYQLGLVARLDSSGRYTVLVTAAQTAGAVVGPAIAGFVAEASGFGAVLWLGAGICAASVAIYGWCAARLRATA